MDYGLAGKVAWVTAASKGLGFASALGLAREGCDLAICSRDEAAIQKAAEAIRQETGRGVLAVPADVTRKEDLDRFAQAALERYGGVDILVSNTGGPPAGPFMQFTDEDWQAAFNLLLLPAVRLSRIAVPSMKARGFGRILYITSGSLRQPVPSLVLSNALRAGITGMMKSLAPQVAKDGITVNCVAPGFVHTDRMDQLDGTFAKATGRSLEVVRAERVSQIPIGRYGTPAEFANAVVFLASQAASYITGSTLLVDGGYINVL